MPDNAPHTALRHHVFGAIGRGEAEPITEVPAIPRRFVIVATTTRTDGTWTATRQVPTFLLDSDTQGIRSADHAARIAADVLGVGRYGGIETSAAVSVATEDGIYLLARTVTPGDIGRGEG